MQYSNYSLRKYINYNILSSKIVTNIINKLHAIYKFLKKGIIYNDIKPDNFVINNENIYNSLKIIDFGCVTYERVNITQNLLTPGYSSPELFINQSMCSEGIKYE